MNNTSVASAKLSLNNNNSSDESVSGEDFDESSNEEKETIQNKKKPRVKIF